MNLEIVIYSNNQNVIDDYLEVFILDGFHDSKKFNQHFRVRFKTADVTNILNTSEFDAIVSAANSLVDMSGGTDRTIAEWYHNTHKVNIQAEALSTVTEMEFTTALGRVALPIGCCALVQPTAGPKLIIAPTMVGVPEDVSGTKNATDAMYSVIRFLYWYNKHKIGPEIRRLLVPCMCTGPGQLQPSESAMQMFTAMARVMNPKFKKRVKGEKFSKEGYSARNAIEPDLKRFSEFLQMAELGKSTEDTEMSTVDTVESEG